MKVNISVGGLWHASALTLELHKRSALGRLYTSFPSFKLPKSFGALSSQISNYGYLEIFQVVGSKMGFRSSTAKAIWFDNLISKVLSPSDVFVVWSSFGLKSIARAREMGAVTVVERGSTHIVEQKDLLAEAYERVGLPKHSIIDERIIERELAEYEIADYICIPSGFVADSFVKRGVKREKLIQIPYGVDTSRFRRNQTASHFRNEKVRILFVGNVGVRKGAPLLLDLSSKVRGLPVEIVIVGPMESEVSTILSKFGENVTFMDKVNTATLIELYQTSHVMVLPSVEEGMARVVLEAIACGLCPICSTHTGAADIIQDGVNGFLFDPYDVDTVAEIIHRLERDRDLLESIADRAWMTGQTFTWARYGDGIMSAYNSMLSSDLAHWAHGHAQVDLAVRGGGE